MIKNNQFVELSAVIISEYKKKKENSSVSSF